MHFARINRLKAQEHWLEVLLNLGYRCVFDHAEIRKGLAQQHRRAHLHIAAG